MHVAYIGLEIGHTYIQVGHAGIVCGMEFGGKNNNYRISI